MTLLISQEWELRDLNLFEAGQVQTKHRTDFARLKYTYRNDGMSQDPTSDPNRVNVKSPINWRLIQVRAIELRRREDRNSPFWIRRTSTSATTVTQVQLEARISSNIIQNMTAVSWLTSHASHDLKWTALRKTRNGWTGDQTTNSNKDTGIIIFLRSWGERTSLSTGKVNTHQLDRNFIPKKPKQPMISRNPKNP